jgi:hypothetical protein
MRHNPVSYPLPADLQSQIADHTGTSESLARSFSPHTPCPDLQHVLLFRRPKPAEKPAPLAVNIQHVNCKAGHDELKYVTGTGDC